MFRSFYIPQSLELGVGKVSVLERTVRELRIFKMMLLRCALISRRQQAVASVLSLV